jgi:DNA-binding transcriptional MerR regulator
MKIYNGKLYNMSEAARELGVHRQTLVYWRKKGWVKVKKDYRDFPVFTQEDLERIKQWRSTIHG